MVSNPDKPSPATSPPPSPEERRARKEARREKQRAANVGRAAKMHASRAEELIAPDTASSDDTVPGLNVGCSGWFYWHWKGLFYPHEMPVNDWFNQYIKCYDTVELNAPFYSWPTINTVKGWVKQLGPRDFHYTVKVCELITHTKRFKGTATLVRDFGYIADLLGPLMGCFLFQLPPSYDYTPARLKSIVGQLDPARRNVVEFRHKTWWNSRVYDAFKDAGIILCSCSAPRLPDELIKTSDEIYLRFHGKTQWYRHDYTADELTAWKNRIADSGCHRVWAYFNNDREGYALKNARDFKMALEKTPLR